MRESLMTLKAGSRTHHVKYYNDDNGHGLTSCGIRVYPSSVTKAGKVSCKTCNKSMAKDGK